MTALHLPASNRLWAIGITQIPDLRNLAVRDLFSGSSILGRRTPQYSVDETEASLKTKRLIAILL